MTKHATDRAIVLDLVAEAGANGVTMDEIVGKSGRYYRAVLYAKRDLVREGRIIERRVPGRGRLVRLHLPEFTPAKEP